MTFKDWWNSKPIWLKGGIIALLVYIGLTIALMPFGQPYDSWTPYWLLPSLVLLTPLTWISNNLPGADLISVLVIPTSLILSIFTYFITGAIIGLIISKIKSKK
jgi:hypothetical protein